MGWQTATVQRRLCGPPPGLGACKPTEVPEDSHEREAKFQRRMHKSEMDFQRRQWEVSGCGFRRAAASVEGAG